MGKPSSQQLSKKSNQSLNMSQRIESSMSCQKIQIMKRKRHRRTKDKIRNLFTKLKNQSVSSSNSSANTTVVSVDRHSSVDTIVQTNPTCDKTSQKRKIDLTADEPVKRRKSENSLIVITDDDVTTNDHCPLSSPRQSNAHITCSTPISKRDSKTLETLIINNFPKPNDNNNTVNLNEEVINLTKEINKDSYLTIDLTEETVNKTNNTVIDVDNNLDGVTQTSDCSLVSTSNGSLSMSGDSDVTVIRHNKAKKRINEVNKFARGISKLNSTEKANLLELIAKNIFSGCKITKNVKASLDNLRLETQSQATETVEDTFIKEVILGESKSRNSIGSNIYHPSKDDKNKKGLRMIVIDGSNVAMEHTKGSKFSVKGLKICIDYFLKRGHVVKAFVPRFRCKYGKSTEPRLLDQLERQGLVVYTPSREIQGRACTPYDDRYIVQCAAEFDGVIVSGDNYRDLINENPRWRTVIEKRVLPFTWVDDMIMFPRDPLGRHGPTLEQFLKHPENNENTIVL